MPRSSGHGLEEGMRPHWTTARWVTIRGAQRSPEGVKEILRMAAEALNDYMEVLHTPFDVRTSQIIDQLDELRRDIM